VDIEEDSPAAAVREVGDRFVHLHVTDTNPHVPSTGHYD
jgi:sugar phosphate isomerase/epimerase